MSSVAPAEDVPAPSVVARVLAALVEGYRRWVSPLLPPSCRFYPSCSEYAVEALRVHGALRGSGLALVRLLKCGPWHPGGVDPVPLRGSGGMARRIRDRHGVRHTPAEE